MRDFASSGSPAGDEPLPPVTTHWVGADGQQPHDDGSLVPPFVPAAPSESVSEEEFWDSLGGNSPGEVMPAFGSPPDEIDEVIPSNAFFIPEGADHLPPVIDPAAAQPAEHRETRQVDISTIAERLEMVARRLRSEGAASLSTKLAAVDSLDTLLAGLLAGYLAAHRH